MSGRQAVAAAAIGDSLYYVGGFNYAPPYTYADTLRLTVDHHSGDWNWEHLPSFPHPIASAGVAAVGMPANSNRCSELSAWPTLLAAPQGTGLRY